MGQGVLNRGGDKAIHDVVSQVVGRVEPDDVKGLPVVGEKCRNRLGGHLNPQARGPGVLRHDMTR